MPTKSGYIHGTGAALEVEIGFVPDYVRIWNATQGTDVFEGLLYKVILYTSLSNALKAGDYIRGITSQATARIREVIIDSGTIAGGNAAGWLSCDAEDITGTLETENAEVYTSDPVAKTAATNHLGIVVDVTFGQSVITTAGPVSNGAGTTDIVAYTGTVAAYRKGFTIGTTISEDGKLLGYFAQANDQGMGSEPSVAGVKQSEGVW